ncbi:MAG: SOUL heme-binding protein [Marine Group III euryarchaeote CG-Epi3]|uniref:SOUL heme-binding protein n=1 Tax=Marine Group III euryarchaeote CG-Epi3 TaxID=1888997 RepID=A0A1J5TPG5_9ARCH|nr:MAG: SOUL heme-binding protein [Marine Group III euryarchaeote CG-Epi3]
MLVNESFQKIYSSKVYEIRKYSESLAIQTPTSSQNSGFRKLFDYISGNNRIKKKIQMTTPVTQMENNGVMTMQFYLPSKLNVSNAPEPSRSDIELVVIEGGYYAVTKYSGRATDENFIKHRNLLENQLGNDNISVLSTSIRATYNGPFTLPMFRRNEVMFKIDYKTNE